MQSSDIGYNRQRMSKMELPEKALGCSDGGHGDVWCITEEKARDRVR